jgi:uncharacterized protein YcfL
MTRIKSLLAASVAALMLAACANQSTEPTADPSAVSTDISKNPHFAAVDSQLTSRLKLQTIGERREGDLLRFQVVVLNDWHADLKFKYQVLWYDAGNMLVGAESRPWHAVSLASGSVHAIEATAPRASADRYVIQLQDN